MFSPEVSVIIPVYNGAKWINDCFSSIISQTVLTEKLVEIVVFNDASTDSTAELLSNWQKEINEKQNLELLVVTSSKSEPQGVGFAKNHAVYNSRGCYLCFQDIDDVMAPNRISKQLQIAVDDSLAIVGSRFRREPENSTVRFTRWANSLKQDLLTVQIYTSHGPTVIMPTWFCARKVFDRVGGFVEDGYGTPEDLIFFYKHLDLNGKIIRVDEELILYRFHPEATTFSISEDTIWKIRIARLEEKILKNWKKFTIWNAGKQGKQFYKSLTEINQRKVSNFCDVDKNKLGKTYQNFNPELRTVTSSIPIIHFTNASPPFVICVKLDMTNGQFELNLNSLNLTEGIDYVLFN